MSRFNARLASDLWFFLVAAESETLEIAADRLSVTQSAVTQRIKRLEEQLGFPLFVRDGRRLKLTDEGSALAGAAAKGFTCIQDKLILIRTSPKLPVVKVSCTPSLATEWLIPALSDLYSAHPEISVAVFAEMEEINERRMKMHKIDIAIRYGLQPPRDLVIIHKATEPVFPVASPSLLSGLQDAEMCELTLLHDAMPWEQESSPTAEWDFWIARYGDPCTPLLRRDQFFNLAHLAYSSASAGNGLALGRQLTASRYLSEGRLVKATPHPPILDFHYFIATAVAEPSTEVRIVSDWLSARMLHEGVGASSCL